MCRARLHQRTARFPMLGAKGDLGGDEPAQQASSNSKVGCALSSGKSWVEHILRAEVGDGLAAESEHLGALLGNHLLQERLGGRKKSSTAPRHAPPPPRRSTWGGLAPPLATPGFQRPC